MKYPVVLVEYLDHFWFRMDNEKDWKKMVAGPTTLVTIGAIVYENEYQMALLSDYGSSNEAVEGHILINVVVKSCIIRRENLGTVRVEI